MESTGNLRREEKMVSKKIIFSLFLFSFCVSVISGVLSGWYFNNFGQKEIVVLDVGKIIEEKRKEFIEKYRDREANPKMRQEMERDISYFIERLNRVIEEESRGRIVLAKDSVISEARDITYEVEKRIKRAD
jgi:hypothetical protein